ncbi:MAG: hypothetical protein RLZZ245_206 [Verrucomicrobiota bacterium]
MREGSIVLVNDDGEAEDLFEKVGLGGHGEAFDSGVCEAGEAQAQARLVAVEFQLRDALGVGALKGVSDAKESREFGDTDAVFRGECAVDWVVEARAGVAVVARDEGDDRDVEAVEAKDLRVENDVFRVFVVGAWADVGADFVEDGGDLEEESVVWGELVEVRELLEEASAEISDMLAMAGVGLVAFREDASGA